MTREYKHDVAISYAGEDRKHAEDLAKLLKDSGYAVFYDRHENSEIWGKDLSEYFAVVFKDESRFCVMFISEHYKAKAWPIHERRSAMVRALKERREYILPIRIDGADIPEIAGIAHLDLRKMPFPDIFKALKEKIVKDRELSAQALVEAAQFRYSFARVEGKEPVHPLIVRELLGGDDWMVDSMKITRINVDRSRGSNRCFHTEYGFSAHGGRIWVECPDVNGHGQFFRYAHIGTSPSGTVILECYRGLAKGPEIYGEIGLFQWKTSHLSDDQLDLAIVEVFHLDDRYEGKIVYENGVLYIHPDQSRWRNGPDSLIERRID